jgi:hypothetical protein
MRLRVTRIPHTPRRLAAQLHCSIAAKSCLHPTSTSSSGNKTGFVWIEAVSDMQFAQDRLHDGGSAPGEYFVFDQKTQQLSPRCRSRSQAAITVAFATDAETNFSTGNRIQ